MKKRPPRGMTGIEVLVLLAIIFVLLSLTLETLVYIDLVQMWSILAWLVACLLVTGRNGARWVRSILIGIIFLVAVFIVLETASCWNELFPMCAKVESKKFNSAPSYEVLSHLARESTGLFRHFEVFDKDFANATMTWEVTGAEDLGENLDRLCESMGAAYTWHWFRGCGTNPRPSGIFVKIYKLGQEKDGASRSRKPVLSADDSHACLSAELELPVLLRALKDTRPMVRYSAMWAIGEKGKEARDAVPDLIEALKNEAENLQICAVIALGAIGPDAKAAAGVLREKLKDPSARLRTEAAFALWKVSGETEEAIPILLEVLTATKDNSYKAVVQYLGEMGSEAKAAVPALKQLEESVPRIEFELRKELDKALQRIQE